MQSVTRTLQAAFPTETVARLLATDSTIVTDEAVRAALGTFFAHSPDFNLGTTRITTYVKEHGDTAFAGVTAEVQAAAIVQLKRVQRAFQISPTADIMSALLKSGLDAADRSNWWP